MEDASSIEAVLSTVRRLLRERGLRYRDLAGRLGVSEVTIKRWMRARDLSLQRLSRISEALGMDLFDLLALAGQGREQSFQLSIEQEAALVDEPLVYAVWQALRHGHPADAVAAAYQLDPARWLQILLRLDALALIELHPGERIRLLHSGVLNWRRAGPLARQERPRFMAWCAQQLQEGTGRLATSSERSVSPAFADEAAAELAALARRWRDRAYRDETSLPPEQRIRIRWVLLLDDLPTFPEPEGS